MRLPIGNTVCWLAAFLVTPLTVAGQQIVYAQDVEPIFHKKCYGCHGAGQQMSGLRLDDRVAALKGGYSGAVIVPGNAAGSKLIDRVTNDKNGFRMPPVGPRLTQAETAALKAWIDSGAEWPATGAKTALQAAARSQLWSLQQVSRPKPPSVKNAAWVRGPIDAFILSRLESRGIQPSKEASKAVLLRRVSFDLTGLPPTPQELRAFLADERPEAYQEVVDRLLASPHYGERWARQWLDLARYADSDGYEKDLNRPHAWRWRQWVIDSLNAGMPFDQFTVAQIAGDLLPGVSTDLRVATGFHRNTLRNREGGVKEPQTFFEETVDRTNTTATVWLGLTVGCAQCHDHKFDPISQKDYYQMHAFFDNIVEDTIDAPMAGEMGPYLLKRQEYLKKRQELLDAHGVPKLMPEWEEKVRLAAKNPGKWPDWDITYDVMFQMTDGGQKVLEKDPKERSFKEQEMLTDYFIDWYHFVVPKQRFDELKFRDLKKKLRALKQSYPQLSKASVIVENPSPHASHLRIRGDYQREGIEVKPDGLSALPAIKTSARATRLDLARWLVSRNNPLTARVAVNRMWQEFFGRGLVRTSDDFGFQGEKPTHPELLDWLATEFMDNGWKSKAMHKLIVMSATYRQASNVRPELKEVDPTNELLSRQNRLRLPAESIRDSALLASGLLYAAVGGKSVFPPQPAGIAELTYAWETDRWTDSTGPDRYRRGLYIHYQRTAPYPLLVNFDAPDRNTSASSRRRSTTPLQALNLLNDPVFLEAAQAAAVRILTEAPTRDDRVDYAFELCLSRKPTARERELALESFRAQRAILDADPQSARALTTFQDDSADRVEIAAWVLLARELMNLDEFVTRP